MALEFGILGSETVLSPEVVAPAGWVGYPQGNAEISLLEACAELAAAGCRIVLGPMQGGTWGAYRLLTGSNGSLPLFPGEPRADDAAIAAFEAAGFAPLVVYYSTIGELREAPEPRAGITARLERRSVKLRWVDSAALASRLAEIHGLVHRGFADQPFFAPLPLSQFATAFAGGGASDCLVAEQDGRLVALARGYRHPDASDVWILKSLVREPEASFAGLGAHLIDVCHQWALKAGYRRVVHALMHEANSSRTCSQRRGLKPLREYALFGRKP